MLQTNKFVQILVFTYLYNVNFKFISEYITITIVIIELIFQN